MGNRCIMGKRHREGAGRFTGNRDMNGKYIKGTCTLWEQVH